MADKLFIINGRNISFSSFNYKWFAYLISPKSDLARVKLHCGGAFLTPNWVVTAASCIDGTNNTFVQAGSGTSSKMPYREYADIRVRHSGYNRDTHFKDIALLRVPKPAVTLTNCLSLVGFSYDKIQSGNGYIFGFGYTSQKRKYSEFLQKGAVLIIPNKKCKEILGRRFVESSVCTTHLSYGANVTACTGDRGGPLTVVLGGRHYLVGLIAVFFKNCEVGRPLLYTRVSEFRDWIVNGIREPDIMMNFYST